MIKISKIYPKDIIAFVVLVFSMFLIYSGINHVVSGIVIMIVTYYFAQRINGEKESDEISNVIKKKVDQTLQNSGYVKHAGHLPIKQNAAPNDYNYSGSINS